MFKINWSGLCALTILAVAVAFESRAFVLGIFTALFFNWLVRKKVLRNEKYKMGLIMISFLIVILFVLSFYVKKDSSSGRILIYKISWQMLKDHWAMGSGIGTFRHEYLNYQAKYFKNGQYTMKELLLADNTKHAFNDYMQWIIETGVWGFVILIGFFMLLFYLFRKVYRIFPDQPHILRIAVYLLISLLVAACITHIFENIYFQLMFVISCCILVSHAFKHYKKEFFLGTVSLVFLIIWMHVSYLIMNHESYKSFKRATALYQAGYNQAALHSYNQLYPTLHRDFLFMSTYSDLLSATANYKASLAILKELVTMDNSYFFHIRLGECYQQLNDFGNAEREFTLAIFMVPNRFMSRYKLFQFYYNSGNKIKARIVADQIFHLPVKIPSKEVTNVKSMIQSDLAKYNR